MSNLLFVACGGAVGAVLRYLIGLIALKKLGFGFPYGTLIVNLSGCFLIGLLMTLFMEKLALAPQWRSLLIVGLLGGLTTFSSFGYETAKLLQTSQYAVAAVNIGGNVFLGLAATLSGISAARLF